MTTAEIEVIKAMGITVTACGSRVTCDPPPTDTDEDFLLLCPSATIVSALDGYLHEQGFQWEGNGEHYQQVCENGFMSFRRGTENFIVTKNPVFAERHGVATYVCKLLNLMDKPTRIKIFQAILYGKTA